jgi:hypothetical protein
MKQGKMRLMGRKSSSKGQSRMPPGESPEPARASTPWLIIAIVAVLAVAGLFAYVRSGRGEADAVAVQSTPPQVAESQPPAEPAYAKFGPHQQANLPPLPFSPVPAARPPNVVNAAYKFAAEHPEVLAYAPCYCGCERSGHRGNDDCFVAARAANGDVTEWEPHGAT